MDDLIARLREAIDETERAARYAVEAGGEGHWSELSSGVLDLGSGGLESLHPIGDLRLVRHIVRHDPASVMRMVAAHRKILDAHDEAERDGRAEAAAYLWTAVVALAEAYEIGA